MIQDISNYVWDTAYWCVGYNNLSAMKKVVNDEYFYTENDPNTLTKVKQIGTEALHIGVKWTTLLTVIDKSFHEIGKTLNLTNSDLGLSEYLPIRVSIPNISTVANYTPTALGLLSLPYNLYVCVKAGKEAWKNFKNIVQTDYDGHAKISINDLGDGIVNVSTIFPLYYAWWNYGSTGSMLAVPIMWGFNHESAANNTYAKCAKIGIIGFTAYNSPITPVLKTFVATPLAWILEKIS